MKDGEDVNRTTDFAISKNASISISSSFKYCYALIKCGLKVNPYTASILNCINVKLRLLKAVNGNGQPLGILLKGFKIRKLLSLVENTMSSGKM